LSTQLCLAGRRRRYVVAPERQVRIRLCNLPDAFVSATRLRGPPATWHRGAHSPTAGSKMFAALHPDKEAHASRAAFDRLLLTATNASALRKTAKGRLLRD
jgi:hypothetical protein